VIATAEQLKHEKESRAPEITIRTLFSSLPWYDGIGIISAIVGLVVTALGIGYRIGSGEWPF
jgi:hypothetical protein